MENLTFQLSEFEGPLDLLPYLLSKNKMKIQDIEIVSLIDQYLAVVNGPQGATLDDTSEFIEMAARLIYMKSVFLLPRSDEQDQLKEELTGMITMKPILEPDVVALLNAGRFEGELEGYVMTDGGNYLGYCLYRVAQGVTTVLDVSAPDHMCRAASATRSARCTTTIISPLTPRYLRRWAQTPSASRTWPAC